jgi:chromate transporter
MNNKPSIFHIFYRFLILGCTAFGGPIAHLAYFNNDLIKRRQWLSPQVYANLMGLCHFIPGPSSSQVGLGIGYLLHGWKGAAAAWIGFTLPSALLMTLIAIGLLNNPNLFSSNTIHYLKIIALAVIAQAIWQMSQALLKNTLSRCLCLATTAIVLFFPSTTSQFIVLVLMGVIGFVFLKIERIDEEIDFSIQDTNHRSTHKTFVFGCTLFVLLMLALPLLSTLIHNPFLTLFDSIYRTGALVFGGGHVVLPILQQEILHNSHIDPESILTGYGLAQALPGPLFTFATYIGALWINDSPWLGAVVATLAIFLPSFILIPAILPTWKKLQYNSAARAILAGLNIAVIAFLLAMLYQPLFASSILSPLDLAITLVVFAGIYYLKLPAWGFVLFTVITGTLLS